MKFFPILVAMMLATTAFCQNILFDPVSNKVFEPEKYSAISGSPFLYDKWQKGSATTSKGVYKDLKLKLDAYSNLLLFSKEDEAYEFQDPVSAFTFESTRDTMKFFKGLTGPSLKPDQFVQILVQGKASLYRSDIKLFADINQINKGLVKSFSTSTRYYLSKDGDTRLIKLNKPELLSLLADKQTEIEAAIKKERLDLKREEDAVTLVKIYNSL